VVVCGVGLTDRYQASFGVAVEATEIVLDYLAKKKTAKL